MTESTVSANVRLQGQNGADILLTVRTGATAGEVESVLSVLAGALRFAKDTYGLTPAPAHKSQAAPATNGANGATDAAGPVCKYHGPMKRSNKFNGWYCPSKMGDGTYCKESVKE